MVLLGGIVEVGNHVRAGRLALERKCIVAGAAGQHVIAIKAEQDIVAAAAVERLVALGGDEDFVGAGAGQGCGRGGVVEDVHGGEIAAGGVAIAGIVGE